MMPDIRDHPPSDVCVREFLLKETLTSSAISHTTKSRERNNNKSPGISEGATMAKSTDPTIEEIRQRCLEIQAGWTPQERWKRLRADLRPTYRRADGEHIEFDAETYEEHVDGQRSFESPDEDWRDPAD